MTLPVIYAFEHAGPEDRRLLEATWRTEDPADRQVAETVALIERLGGRDYTRDQARSYRDKALAELDAAGVVDAAALESLRGIIVSAIKA
jgi:geranylgeranyl pyrophosphate synthase